jgi:Nif-specific regulatory protein
MNKAKLKNIKELSDSQFQTLYEISQALNSAEYEDSLIEDSLDLVIEVINAERGLFTKYDEKEDKFEIVSARNFQKENIENMSEFSSGLLRKVLQKRKPLLYHDVQSDPQISQFQSVQIQKIKSVIAVPVIRNEKVWGIILADSQMNRKEFTDENLIFFNFFSNLLSLALDRILEYEKLRDENEYLKNQLETTERIPDMLGSSRAMRDLSKVMHRVAKTDATVLILGESGTGKDLAAQAIHKLSARRDNPFIAQFCGSIPDNLLESELFGYKKGAFTGADSDKKGLLEVADNGTFFLDEIADISPALQAKLLRVLENQEIMRLGDTQVRKVNVRILAATNKDLKKLASEGKFREDLFYRLNVFPLKLPPLRDRKEDIPLLASYFISKYSDQNLKLDRSAIKKLQDYNWRGNVRQLLNVIQRAVILCDGSKLLPEHIILEEDELLNTFDGTLKEFEMLLLKKRLDELNGNRTHTAESLGVSVRWIQMKLKEMNED